MVNDIGTNSAASGGVDSIYIAVSVVAILLTLSSGIAVVVCSYSRLLPGLICTVLHHDIVSFDCHI